MDLFAVWTEKFQLKVKEITTSISDPSHDFFHFERVARTARVLGTKEGADLNIVLPSAWLHDFVHIEKNDPRRKQASHISAVEAVKWLLSISYPEKYFEGIAHAIEAHSFSAGIEARTIEAKVVQDADRLEGIGAIGIARCFTVTGRLARGAYYEPTDPFCEKRVPNDSVWTIDHFYAKLFKTAETMNTKSAREEAAIRVEFMKKYLSEFSREISLS